MPVRIDAKEVFLSIGGLSIPERSVQDFGRLAALEVVEEVLPMTTAAAAVVYSGARQRSYPDWIDHNHESKLLAWFAQAMLVEARFHSFEETEPVAWHWRVLEVVEVLPQLHRCPGGLGDSDNLDCIGPPM